jgi:hypothetical protein
VLGLLGVLVLLTGCSDFVDRDQTALAPERAVILEPGHAVGQTFVARHGGLNGVEFWLEVPPGSVGVLRLHLRPEPQSSTDLAVAELPLEAVGSPGFYRFSFPADNQSHSAYRYAFLELDGAGMVRVGAAPGDAYIDGAAYRDHEPLDAQLAFRLTYTPWGMALELGRAVLEGIGLLAVAALLYLVPGYALVAWLWRPHPSPGGYAATPSPLLTTGQERGGGRGWGEVWPARMALAVGLSLALYPLLLLWTDLVGLHLGPLYAWGPVLLGLAALAWRYRRWRPRQGWEALRAWARSDALWPDLALVVILALVFGVRLLVVRTLDAPMWGDSYQHAVIAQLLVDNGGLFDSWEPYTPYRGLTVHFGFPAAVALLSWMTGLEIPRATLLTGQLVNGLAVLTLYPLAVRLARGNRWAGVGAVLVAGLLSPMPAYYVNWGRFAQLAGQAVLPVALWLLWEGVDRERVAWGPLLLAGLALGGMILHYYRMPFYYATFVLAWLVGWGLPEWKADGRRWLGALGRMALVAGVALLLVIPWGSYIAGGRLAGALEAGTSAPTASEWERVLADYQVWRDVAWYVPWPLLGATSLALVWALARRRWAVAACRPLGGRTGGDGRGAVDPATWGQYDAELRRPDRPVHPGWADGGLADRRDCRVAGPVRRDGRPSGPGPVVRPRADGRRGHPFRPGQPAGHTGDGVDSGKRPRRRALSGGGIPYLRGPFRRRRRRRVVDSAPGPAGEHDAAAVCAPERGARRVGLLAAGG